MINQKTEPFLRVDSKSLTLVRVNTKKTNPKARMIFTMFHANDMRFLNAGVEVIRFRFSEKLLGFNAHSLQAPILEKDRASSVPTPAEREHQRQLLSSGLKPGLPRPVRTPHRNCRKVAFPAHAAALWRYSPSDRKSLRDRRSSIPAVLEWSG